MTSSNKRRSHRIARLFSVHDVFSREIPAERQGFTVGFWQKPEHFLAISLYHSLLYNDLSRQLDRSDFSTDGSLIHRDKMSVSLKIFGCIPFYFHHQFLWMWGARAEGATQVVKDVPSGLPYVLRRYNPSCYATITWLLSASCHQTRFIGLPQNSLR